MVAAEVIDTVAAVAAAIVHKKANQVTTLEVILEVSFEENLEVIQEAKATQEPTVPTALSEIVIAKRTVTALGIYTYARVL